jgi:hypothetical protein
MKKLELLSTVQMPAITTWFLVKENFKEDLRKDSPVKIARVSEEFKREFGRVAEDTTEAVELKIYRLREYALHISILAELGDTCMLTLGQIFALLQKQRKGEEGPLLTDGGRNLAYAWDIGPSLRAVRLIWDSDRKGWHVDFSYIESALRCPPGFQFISR